MWKIKPKLRVKQRLRKDLYVSFDPILKGEKKRKGAQQIMPAKISFSGKRSGNIRGIKQRSGASQN